LPIALLAALGAAHGYGAEVPLEVLEADRRALKKALDDGSNPDAAIILVLGATAQEAGRFPVAQHEGKDLTRWVFLSSDLHEPSAALHVRCDFNDAYQLFLLSAALRGRLAAIIPDWSVMKFTRWNEAHLGHLKAMLRPDGTLFLPVATWGGNFHLGLSVDGTVDPEDYTPATGDPAEVAGRFAALIHRAMSYADRVQNFRVRAPLLFPSNLLVPQSWVRLDAATQAGVLAEWEKAYHVPAMERTLREKGKFGTVNRVRFTPSFMKDRPDPEGGYLACKP
jgi:hypothetical protein